MQPFFQRTELLGLMDRAKASPDLHMVKEQLVLYPFLDSLTKQSHVSIAFAATVSGADNDPHTVVVSFTQKRGFSLWCGDRFLEGDGNRQYLESRAANALGLKELTEVDEPSDALARSMATNIGTYARSDRCHFWATWARKREVCEHVSHVLAQLRDHRPDFIEALKAHYSQTQAFVVGQ